MLFGFCRRTSSKILNIWSVTVLSVPAVARRWIPVLRSWRIEVGFIRAASLMALTACCWRASFVFAVGGADISFAKSRGHLQLLP